MNSEQLFSAEKLSYKGLRYGFIIPYIPVYKPQLFVSKNGTQSRHAAYHKHTVS